MAKSLMELMPARICEAMRFARRLSREKTCQLSVRKHNSPEVCLQKSQLTYYARTAEQ